MARTVWTTVDDYLAAQSPTVRAALVQVRRAIRKALPTADEVISYQIPAYRTADGLVLFFAGWQAHYSLYPATAAVVREFAADLAGCEISKGTIRFPLHRRVPVGLIGRIAKFKAREAEARAAARAGRKRSAPAARRVSKARARR